MELINNKEGKESKKIPMFSLLKGEKTHRKALSGVKKRADNVSKR